MHDVRLENKCFYSPNFCVSKSIKILGFKFRTKNKISFRELAQKFVRKKTVRM